jgi:hypothetical protein
LVPAENTLAYQGSAGEEKKIDDIFGRNVLDKLIEKFPHVGVVFVDDENKAGTDDIKPVCV